MSEDKGELVVVEPTDHTPPGNGQAVEIRSTFDIKPSTFKAGLERRGKNRTALMEWIRKALVEGTDFGRIHVVKKDQCPDGKYCSNPYHFSKPSLWKSGAEKIAGMMGMRSTWPNLDAEMEIVRAGTGKFLMLKCQLVDSGGNVVSEGIGARALEQDYGDVNKAFKMAKKSSLIDAVLNAGGLSEVFTQDVEDMKPEQFPEDGGSDPYQKGDDRVDHAMPNNRKAVSTHCPIGKEWKGVPWTEVDSGFLEWIISKIDDKPDILAAAKKELESRSVETDEAKERRQETRLDTPAKSMADYARAITNATTVDQLLAIGEELQGSDLEPGLRTYLTARENELTP